MIADRLRAAILQAAISGKLTDQRPEDGTAAELLEQIAAERDALVKEGKLRRQKPLPPVMDEDRPFPIPSNWVWARFGEATRYAQRGKSPKYAAVSRYLAVSQKCVRWTGFDPALARPYAPEAFATLPQERILSAGDILWNSTGTGTVGRSTVLPESADVGNMAADSHVTVIRTFPEVLPRFVNVFISSPHIQQNMDDLTSGTTKQQELNLGTILELPLPLPPLAEQERIVARLDEILPLIDQLAELEREREHLDREFAKAIERAILQAAISGKLTKQHPEDGTAEELLETTKTERQQLEKAGKIKKQKRLPPVEKEDEPFELPQNWSWVRLGQVAECGGGTTPKGAVESDSFAEGKVPFFRVSAMNIPGNEHTLLTPSSWIGADTKSRTPHPSVAFPKNGGAVFTNKRRKLLREGLVDLNTGYVFPIGFSLDYLHYWFTTIDLATVSTGSALPTVNAGIISKLPMPLPPEPEQGRIIDKLDETLPLAQELKALMP